MLVFGEIIRVKLIDNQPDWAVIVAVIAVCLSAISLGINIRNSKAQQVDNTFFNLLELLTNSVLPKNDLVDRTFNNIQGSKQYFLEDDKRAFVQNWLKKESNGKQILKVLYKNDPKHLNETYKQFISKTRIWKASDEKLDYYELIARHVNHGLTLSESEAVEIFQIVCAGKADQYIDKKEFLPVLKYSKVLRTRIIEDSINILTYGRFFRTVHRLFKLMDECTIEKQHEYVGILRAQLTEKQLILLYLNAEYTHRGEKFKEVVKDKDFWGDRSELNEEPPIHFSNSLLIWSDDKDRLINEYTTK